MKPNQKLEEWKEPTDCLPLTGEEQKVMIRAGLHCQICNASGKLYCHERSSELLDSKPNDVLALCASCYELAQIRKRKRMQTRTVRILQLVCLTVLYFGLVAILMVLANLFPLKLLLLCLLGIGVVFLLEWLSSRWL